MSSRGTEPCFHGGAYESLLGQRLERLDLLPKVILADVLDAWFPPCPGAVEVMRSHGIWATQTAPPIRAEGLEMELSERLNVNPDCLMVGAGSSDLIFRALGQWIERTSTVLLTDPSYGEYAHYCKNVAQCDVRWWRLNPKDRFMPSLPPIEHLLQEGIDWVFLVNPNNPTGYAVPPGELEHWLRTVLPSVRVWLDETYCDLAAMPSLVRMAQSCDNLIVCTSLSKSLALSGLRLGYLVSSSLRINKLRPFVPPWNIGTLTTLVAFEALRDPSYYEQRYQETRLLRSEFAEALAAFGEVQPSVANWVNLWLPAQGSSKLADACRENGVLVRDLTRTSALYNDRVLRIAVRSSRENKRVVEVLHQLSETQLC